MQDKLPFGKSEVMLSNEVYSTIPKPLAKQILLNTCCPHSSVIGKKGNIGKQILFTKEVIIKRAEDGVQFVQNYFNRYSKFANCKIFLFLLILSDPLVVTKSKNKNTDLKTMDFPFSFIKPGIRNCYFLN